MNRHRHSERRNRHREGHRQRGAQRQTEQRNSNSIVIHVDLQHWPLSLAPFALEAPGQLSVLAMPSSHPPNPPPVLSVHLHHKTLSRHCCSKTGSGAGTVAHSLTCSGAGIVAHSLTCSGAGIVAHSFLTFSLYQWFCHSQSHSLCHSLTFHFPTRTVRNSQQLSASQRAPSAV